MSKKNYTNYSKMAEEAVEEAVETVEVPEVVEAVETVEVPEVVEQPAEPEVPVEEVKTLKGIVTGCAKLNIREEPSVKTRVLAIVDASNEMAVYQDESFGNFYKVCTASGIEGYCMKDYVTLM